MDVEKDNQRVPQRPRRVTRLAWIVLSVVLAGAIGASIGVAVHFHDAAIQSAPAATSSSVSASASPNNGGAAAAAARLPTSLLSTATTLLTVSTASSTSTSSSTPTSTSASASLTTSQSLKPLTSSKTTTTPTTPSKTTTTTTSATPTSSALGKGVALRIMPLGASITYGLMSTDGNGYRDDLFLSLTQLGNAVDMVGNQANGTMQDNLNEGWPGYVTDQIQAKASASVPKWMPNVVLVNAGTNDCIQNLAISGAGSRMATMLAGIWSVVPSATIVLSSLLVNADAATEQNILQVNPQYAALASQLQGQGKKLVYVDMHGSNGPQLSDLVDGTHPDNAGYAKMATIWMSGLQLASSNGWLTPPS